MSTRVVTAVDNESKADCTLLVPGRILAGEGENGSGVEDLATKPVGRLLYRLAEHIRGVFGWLFRWSVHDSEPLEKPDSDYPGCWSCCCCL